MSDSRFKLRRKRAKSLVKCGRGAWTNVGRGSANLQGLRDFTGDSGSVRMASPVVRHTACV